MNANSLPQAGPEHDGLRQRSLDLRKALLTLHKVLIDSERVTFEKTMGEIQSPNHFLQLLTNDPWFGSSASSIETIRRDNGRSQANQGSLVRSCRK